jgi:hypothetical protein
MPDLGDFGHGRDGDLGRGLRADGKTDGPMDSCQISIREAELPEPMESGRMGFLAA